MAILIISIASFVIVFSVFEFSSSSTPSPPIIEKKNKETSSFRFDSSPTFTNHTAIIWTMYPPLYVEGKNYVAKTWPISYCTMNNCIFTFDRRNLSNADAVVFNSRDFNKNDIPRRPSPDQVWIFLSLESPLHDIREPFKLLNGLINWTVSHRADSDITNYGSFIERPEPLESLPGPIPMNRSRSVYWLVSNCRTPSKRETYVRELSKYIDVDIYGGCGTKKCVPKMSPQCYDKLASQYYFYLAFENSICKDYVTEKLHFAFQRPVVPIVLGGADEYYYKIAPPHSLINALDYQPRELAAYLHTIINSPAEYLKFFEWRKKYKYEYKAYSCEICRLLNEKVKHRKVWSNLPDWYDGGTKCRSWQEAIHRG